MSIEGRELHKLPDNWENPIQEIREKSIPPRPLNVLRIALANERQLQFATLSRLLDPQLSTNTKELRQEYKTAVLRIRDVAIEIGFRKISDKLPLTDSQVEKISKSNLITLGMNIFQAGASVEPAVIISIIERIGLGARQEDLINEIQKAVAIERSVITKAVKLAEGTVHFVKIAQAKAGAKDNKEDY